MLLKLHMHGGYVPCPPDPNAVLFLEQMLSFGSPTAVIGSRAAIGHVLYVAEMLSGVGADKLTTSEFEALSDDMRRPPSARQRRHNRYRSIDANKLVFREWLFGSRRRAAACGGRRALLEDGLLDARRA